MYLLLTDETNKEPSDSATYFIYGGLFVPAEKAGALHSRIESARSKVGYAPTDKLKFDTNVRPKHLTQDTVTALKKEVIELCVTSGCKFSVLVIHHGISKNKDIDTRIFWAARHVIGHFNYFLLTDANDYGWVLADRLPVNSPEQFFSDTFANGLELDDGRRVRLERIVGLSPTSLGCSHLCSAIDIVLGTFRFCINNLSSKERVKPMLNSVAQMLWYLEKDGKKYIRERGLILRPKTITAPYYQKQYDELVATLEQLLNAV